MFGFFKTLFGRRPVTVPPTVVDSSSAIEPDRDMVAAEHRAFEAMFVDVEARLLRSAVFKPDQVPVLLSKLRATNRPFGRTNVEGAMAGETYLSADEKRALGLNARMKYSHAFIAMCDPQALATVEPKNHLAVIYVAAYWAAQRIKQLSEFRRIGIVLRVKISPGGEADPCDLANSKRTFRLDLAPTLPHPKCKCECCTCSFDAAKLVP